MARIEISNAWGAGIDMSAYNEDGWGHMVADEMTGALELGFNTIVFDAYGYASFDTLEMDYYLYYDEETVDITGLYYYQGNTLVLSLDAMNIRTTVADLNAPTWYVRFNQGHDDFYGNDYADIIKGGYGDDLIVGYHGNDTLSGGDGQDVIGGGAGNDRIYGGYGLDVASYGGTSTRYAFVRNADGSVTVVDKVGGHGTDTIYDIEELYFDDGLFSLSSLLEKEPSTPNGDPYTGDAGNNVLEGGSGRDRVDGKGGDDVISGGNGNDTLVGGSGKDVFVFDYKPNKRSNRDKIADYKVADDTIHLDNGAFRKIGSDGKLKSKAFWANNTGKAHDRSDRIIYEKDTGKLFYDPDGTGSAESIHFATAAKKLKMTHAEFYVI